MKATRYIFSAALTVIAAASCQKENTSGIASEVIVNATIENTDTKTVLGEGYTGTDGKVHHKVLWLRSDNISVFDANGNNHRFISYAADNSEVAKFQKVADAYTKEAFVTGNEYHAIYPGTSDNSIDINTKTITVASIDNNQKPVKNGFTDDLAVAYGYGTESYTSGEKTYVNMTFMNITALIKFELVGNDITEVRFLDKNAAYLAGANFTVTFSGNEITPSLASGKKQIFMNNIVKNEDNTYSVTPLEAGIYYMVIVPPANVIKPRISITTQTTASGSTINGSYSVDKTGKAEVQLKPGMILDLGKWSSTGQVTE